MLKLIKKLSSLLCARVALTTEVGTEKVMPKFWIPNREGTLGVWLSDGEYERLKEEAEHPIYVAELGWLSPEEAEELGREHKAKELQWQAEEKKLHMTLSYYTELPSSKGYLAPEPARRLAEALRDAIVLAADGWRYAADYSQDKWDFQGRLNAVSAILSDPAVQAILKEKPSRIGKGEK